MKTIIVIGAGSFLGGVLRYLAGQFVQAKTTSVLPLGTLLVNITGCLLIGFLFGIMDRGPHAAEWRLFIGAGLLGGFTTFSAFSMETVALYRDGQFGPAIAYIVLSVLGGLLATFAAYSAAARFI